MGFSLEELLVIYKYLPAARDCADDREAEIVEGLLTDIDYEIETLREEQE
jgi:predicted hydrolase (HD superfamily)